MRSLEAIRREHGELLPHVAALLDAADAVDLPGRSAFELVDDSWRFLDGHLLRHARHEEAVLYPALTRVLGSAEAVDLLVLDHRTIAGLVDELGGYRRQLLDRDVVEPHVKRELRRVLYSLHSMLQAHFEKEEAVVLPTLEASLTQQEAERLLHELSGHHVGT